MATKRRTLKTILQSTTSRKAFRLVSRDELTRVGLSHNTKLLVPKTLKRVTLKTVTIKPSELSKVAKARGAKREKLLERAASKIASVKKTATQQTVKRQKRRDTKIETAAKQTSNTPASYRTFVTIDGRSHRPMMQGSNLDKLNEHHAAIWQWLHGTHSTSELEAWAHKYPDATVYDVNGHAYRIPKNTREFENSYGRMSKKGRKDTNKKYQEDAA
jgi:hypothetical protein